MSCLSSSFVSSSVAPAFHARSSSVAGCSVVVPQTVRSSRGLFFFLFPLIICFSICARFSTLRGGRMFLDKRFDAKDLSSTSDGVGGAERLLETRRMTDAPPFLSFSRAMYHHQQSTSSNAFSFTIEAAHKKRDRFGQKWSRFEPKVQRGETVRPRKMPRGEHHRPSVRKQVPRRAGRRNGERLYLVRVERWGNLV